MIIDPKNALTVATLIANKSQVNNTGNGGLDLTAGNYKGKLMAIVSIGAPSAGDVADRTIAVRITTSDTNNISNGTNYGTSTVTTTNNATVGTISIDTRDAKRYVFAVPAIAGGNTPAYPLTVVTVGTEEVQPPQ